jgi:hypothetical protein
MPSWIVLRGNALKPLPDFARRPDRFRPWLCSSCRYSMLFREDLDPFCLRRECGKVTTGELIRLIDSDVVFANPPFRFRLSDPRHAEEQLALTLRLLGFQDAYRTGHTHPVDAVSLRAVGEMKRWLGKTRVGPRVVRVLNDYARDEKKVAFLGTVGPCSSGVPFLADLKRVVLLRFDVQGRFAPANLVAYNFLRVLDSREQPGLSTQPQLAIAWTPAYERADLNLESWESRNGKRMATRLMRSPKQRTF